MGLMHSLRARWQAGNASGFVHPHSSEITPQAVYQERREWLQQMTQGAAVAALGPMAWGQAQAQAVSTIEKPTAYKDATNYNNFYEFGTDKTDPARYAHTLVTHPWQIDIEGLVKRPLRLDLDDIRKLRPPEERIYRLRCVEGWSMVIPWMGFPLAELIRRSEPLGSAKFVEFISLADAKTMPGVRSRVLDWPYVEGLRMDEAMHPLTLLGLGMYGETLPKQNGAPVRIVVPWKYGFKSAKSIVKIRFVEAQPVSSWERSVPQEYGFYSNVNPLVDHPRWSQATERRIGEDGLFAKKRKTLMFNGYEAQVGQLYAGMDLRKYF